MKRYPISDIERAVNYWRAAEGPHDGLNLGRHASELATIYGAMIFEHAESVPASTLNSAMADAIDFALQQMPLPFVEPIRTP